MSYDLTVYGDRSLSRGDLTDIVKAAPDMDVAEEAEQHIAVTRGKRASYCFTVDGPFDVEPEDVPEELATVAIGVTVMYQVLVEGSADLSIPHALRFSKRLAASVNGAMIDQQTGAMWSGKTNRTVTRPKVNERIDLIEITWHFPHDARDLASLYMRTARKYLPEALPRRFGEFEPLQHKLETLGDSGFADAADKSTGLLNWKGSFPVTDGNLATRHWDGSPRALPTFSLSLERSAFEEEKWRNALRSLFVEFGRKGHAFFASAEVTRNVLWSGRSVWYDGKEEYRYSLTGRAGWMGLPPYPVWWALFGREYVPLVLPHVASENEAQSGQALFNAWSDAPMDRDALGAMLPTVGFLRRARAPWLPRELISTQLPFNPGHYPRPLAKASVIPESLGTSNSSV
ncbi:hypothetical protein IWX81_000967 [Salinibacterium sp. CAN_S4]|uniref:hypothetical protein n=1 Tax=Salinibacterium sp. CAN_S4 TaxID=2787727 RepID=UPI0018EFA641